MTSSSCLNLPDLAMSETLCVYDAGQGGESDQYWTHWGRHYEEYERDLTRTEVLPYLKDIREREKRKPARRVASTVV